LTNKYYRQKSKKGSNNQQTNEKKIRNQPA